MPPWLDTGVSVCILAFGWDRRSTDVDSVDSVDDIPHCPHQCNKMENAKVLRSSSGVQRGVCG